MEYDFAEYELNLYLDTHPEDLKALRFFNKVSNKAKELRKLYEEKFGPITASENNSEDSWRWIENPWPWDK